MFFKDLKNDVTKVVITGGRRSGKTTLITSLTEKLREQGINVIT
jgi:molybdopterin-guanine dinucleotide biosynthesis protein